MLNVMSFATIPEAIEELRAGRMLVVVDDEDRENEGDLTMAASSITPEAINFMATFRWYRPGTPRASAPRSANRLTRRKASPPAFRPPIAPAPFRWSWPRTPS